MPLDRQSSLPVLVSQAMTSSPWETMIFSSGERANSSTPDGGRKRCVPKRKRAPAGNGSPYWSSLVVVDFGRSFSAAFDFAPAASRQATERNDIAENKRLLRRRMLALRREGGAIEYTEWHGRFEFSGDL